MSSMDAHFDCLAIGNELSSIRFVGTTEPEFQLLGYLSCLLSLFEQHAASEWGYSFVATPYGYPFSEQIQESIVSLTSSGLFSLSGSQYLVSDKAKTLYDNLSQHSIFAKRINPIRSATSCLILFPSGLVQNAVANNKDITSSINFSRTEHLFSDNSVAEIYEIFGQIINILGYVPNDLVVPASIWLRYQYSLSEDNLIKLTS